MDGPSQTRGWDRLFRTVTYDLTHVVRVLEADPLLEGCSGHGRGASSLSAGTMEPLTKLLMNIDSCLDMGSCGLVAMHGNISVQEPVGSQFARALLLGHPALCAQLLRLAALAVRWPGCDTWLRSTSASPGHTAAARDTSAGYLRDLGILCLTILDKLMQALPLEQSCRLACSLLRMHTLEACSRSLAQAVHRCTSERPAGAPPAPSQGALVGLRSTVLRAIAVVKGLAQIAGRMREEIWVYEPDGGSGGVPRGAGASSSSTSDRDEAASAVGSGGAGDSSQASSRAPPYVAALVALLREALPGSSLLEHLARGVLHLTRAVGLAPSPMSTSLLECYVDLYSKLAACLDTVPGLAAVRDAVLGSPCATYLTAAAGLHTLCTADGGTSYGMRPMFTEAEVRSCWLRRAANGGGHDVSWAGDVEVRVLNSPLFSLAYAMVYRPPMSRSALEVLGRLVNLAVASAQHAAGAGPGPSGGGGGGGGGGSTSGRLLPRPVLPLENREGAVVAATALKHYWQRVPLLPARRRQAAQAEGWQLTVAAVRHTSLGADIDSVQPLVKLLHMDVGPLPQHGSLPPQPPPALAAALSAGLLPCLERLVRRAGESSRPAEGRLLTSMLKSCRETSYLPWLLAYGSPTEAAALITSVGKLMRGAASTASLSMVHYGYGLSYDHLLVNAAYSAAASLAYMSWWVEEGLQREEAEAAARGAGSRTGAPGGAAAAGGPGSGPAAQLRRMAVLAACEWLPVLSGVVIETASKVLTICDDQQVAELPLSNTLMGLMRWSVYACIRWLRLEAPGAQGAGGAGPSTSSALPAAAGGAAGGEILGARRLRLVAQGARVVELLGAGMRLEGHMRSLKFDGSLRDMKVTIDEVTGRLLAVSCLFAVNFPGEVRRALVEGASGGPPVPAACTWGSGVALYLLTDVPILPTYTYMGQTLVQALATWEKGQGGALATQYSSNPTPAVKVKAGHGLLGVLGGEVQQPSPLRRCSWWRCTNLAGDSEAGLPLMECGGCGGAWYCRRECQAAHWREGHKRECGGRG